MKRTSITVGGGVLALSLLVATPAQAATVTPHDDAGSEIWTVGDQCPADVLGFPVTHTWDVTGVYRTLTKEGQALYGGTNHILETFAANGKEFTRRFQQNFTTQSLTDHGDGTLTVVQSFTFNDVFRQGTTVAFHDAGRGVMTLLEDTTTGEVALLDVQTNGRGGELDELGLCEALALHLG